MWQPLRVLASLISPLVLAGSLLSGCQGHVPPPSEPASAPTTQASDILPNDGTRQVGDITACPVSGDVFTVAADSPKVERDGKTWWFCCPGCVDKFNADPGKYGAM